MINVDINTYGIDISLGKVIIRSVSYSEYEVLNSLGDLLFSGRIESGQTASIVAPDAYYYLRNSNSDFVLSGQVPSETTEYISLSDSYYVLFNSDEDFVASGSTLYGQTSLIVAPDANYTLVNSSGNTLSSSTIASSGSTTIIAPDAQYTINYESGTFVQSGNTASGEIKNITIQDFPTDEWQRPSNLLARPTIATGEKVIYLLCRVFPDETLNWFTFGLRCTINNYYGSITVNWGDGQIITYPGGNSITAEHLIDYSLLSDWWDDTHTSKQVWVVITPEITTDIDGINICRRTNSHSNYCNYGIIEILIGHIGNIGYANTGFYFNNLNNLISMVMYEPITLANNWFGFVDYCTKLENLVGVIIAPTWNNNGAQNTYNLKYVKDFKLQGIVEMYNFFNGSGIPEINMPDLVVYNPYATFANSKSTMIIVNDIVGAANSTALNCYNLEKFELITGDGSNCTQYYRFFYGNYNLRETPTLNLVNSTNNSGMFYNCYALLKSNLSNITKSIGFYSCNLSHAAIYEIFDEQLLTVASTQTIDLRLNPDIANLPVATIAIATAKNWAVQIS